MLIFRVSIKNKPSKTHKEAYFKEIFVKNLNVGPILNIFSDMYHRDSPVFFKFTTNTSN